MSLLSNENNRPIYVNISKGKFVVKQKDQEPLTFTTIKGFIVGITFSEEEYQGKKFEVAKIMISDNEEKAQLQMRTDSGYFRGFVNSLRSGNPLQWVVISPFYKEVDNKPETTCFVSQDGKVLKHYFTKAAMGNLPPLKEVKDRKGNKSFDGTDQLKFWKDWLMKQNFSLPIDSAKKEVAQLVQSQVPFAGDDHGTDDLPF